MGLWKQRITLIVAILSSFSSVALAFASPSSSNTGAPNNSNNTIIMKKVCIVGAGPAGLYLAHLLLQQDPHVHVDIIEKAPVDGTPDANAFGFGVGLRHQRYLEQIPGLWPRIEAKSAPATGGPKVRIIDRSVLCQELWSSLQETHNNNGSDDDNNNNNRRCTLSYDTACQTINLQTHVLVTSQGDEIHYDLLIGCDGVNSMIRQQLVDERGLQEEHYLRDALWKCLRVPKQPAEVLDPGAFKPLSHPIIKGAIFPRFPHGHTALFFWKDLELNNPRGIQSEADLLQTISTAVQPKASKWDFARKIMFWRVLQKSKTSSSSASDGNEEISVQFDHEEAARCLASPPRHEHYLKLDRYHDSAARVALVGDAAHGMYSFLGQGAACAFQSALFLSQSLAESKDLNNDNVDVETALEMYSSKAVPEGHAAVDLNLLAHSVFGSPMAKLLAIPLLLANALRGKLIITRLKDDVSYQQLAKENAWLVAVSRYFWKKWRVPFTRKGLPGSSSSSSKVVA